MEYQLLPFEDPNIKPENSEAKVIPFPGGGGFLGGVASTPPRGKSRTIRGRKTKIGDDGKERFLDTDREVDPIWEALIEILGVEPRTDSENRAFGKIVASFKRAGATTEELQTAAAEYRKAWPGIDLTLWSIEKWFGHFLSKKRGKNAPSQSKFQCHCGIDCKTADKLRDHQDLVH